MKEKSLSLPHNPLRQHLPPQSLSPLPLSSLAATLVRDILDYMRQNSQTRISMLTALADTASRAVVETGRTYSQYTPVIASQILPINQLAITNILNTIWPPVQHPNDTPSQWSYRSPRGYSILSDHNSDSDINNSTPAPHVRQHTTRRPHRVPSPPVLARGITFTTNNNLPVNISLHMITRHRSHAATNRATAEGLDPLEAENMGQGVYEYTMQDSVNAHTYFLGNQSRPPTPGETGLLFPPSQHSEDFVPTQPLVHKLHYANHANIITNNDTNNPEQQSLLQTNLIKQFSSPPPGLSQLTGMTSISMVQQPLPPVLSIQISPNYSSLQSLQGLEHWNPCLHNH